MSGWVSKLVLRGYEGTEKTGEREGRSGLGGNEQGAESRQGAGSW